MLDACGSHVHEELRTHSSTTTLDASAHAFQQCLMSCVLTIQVFEPEIGPQVGVKGREDLQKQLVRKGAVTGLQLRSNTGNNIIINSDENGSFLPEPHALFPRKPTAWQLFSHLPLVPSRALRIPLAGDSPLLLTVFTSLYFRLGHLGRCWRLPAPADRAQALHVGGRRGWRERWGQWRRCHVHITQGHILAFTGLGKAGTSRQQGT